MTTNAPDATALRTEYLLYWAAPDVARQIAGDKEAIRQLPLSYHCWELDDALGHARLRREAGAVPLMIEGPDGTLLDRAAIEKELRVRAAELQGRPRVR